MTFCNRLKMLRKEKGASMVRVAEDLDIPYNTYVSYETGAREPGHAFLISIAQYYGVTIDFLLGLESVPYRQAASTELGDISDLSEHDLEDIHDFIQMKKAKLQRKKDSQDSV